MDIHFEHNGVSFIWNSKKATLNRNKHDGITFEHATQAFFDPFFKLVNASRNDEDRDAVIGYDRVGRLLFVVHIEIEGEYIRIISARKATTSEHNVYDI
jgi:uncharacterized DUF497 family protein